MGGEKRRFFFHTEITGPVDCGWGHYRLCLRGGAKKGEISN